MKKPVNENYCATIVKVQNTLTFDNCDNVHGVIVLNSQVIGSKDIKKDDVGVFFPLETRLSEEFLKANNLYRDGSLNEDENKKGYFEKNGRIRCVKFRGHQSEGIFLPLSCFDFCYEGSFDVGDKFDELNDTKICCKYEVKKRVQVNTKNTENKGVSRLVDNQFELHVNTSHLKRSIDDLELTDIVSITKKMHGTSASFGNVLVKKELSWKDNIAKKLGVNVIETEYSHVYASRNVVRNKNFGASESDNVWKEWNDKLKGLIPEGYTLYGEIVGYSEHNKMIQKGYHYGCTNGYSELYVYRVTNTNVDGFTIELDRKQIEVLCERIGVKVTPMFYYGAVKSLLRFLGLGHRLNWKTKLIESLDEFDLFDMNNIACEMNDNEVPAEGCVVRIEHLLHPKPMKLKNMKFYERETKALDNGDEGLVD